MIDRVKVRAGYQTAFGRIVRDSAAPRRWPGARGRDRHAARNTCSRRSSRVLCAATRCRSWSRGSSRSTIRWARARAATGWDVSVFSIRSAWSRFPQLSLASGAIKGWDRRNQFYFQMLQALANALWVRSGARRSKSCRSACQQSDAVRLRAARRFASLYVGERGKKHNREHPFEGIIPNLERRYRETDSPVVREELAKYLNTQPCPECGARGCGARRVTSSMGDQTIYEHQPHAADGRRARFLRRARRCPAPSGDRRQDRRGDPSTGCSF